MRVLLISDIHANPWALDAVERDAGAFDHVLCAGDIVNYGPAPSVAVSWLTKHQAVVVRGNHDHAVAFDTDPKASPAKEPLALAMRDWTRDHLDPFEVGTLLSHQRRLDWKQGGTKFTLVHGTPIDPLYDYRLTPGVSDDLLDELIASVHADVLLVGHTHLPLLRRRRGLQIVNPGSVGQPLDGNPQAAYAIWENGEITLRRVGYDQTEIIRELKALPLEQSKIDDLVRTLVRGSLA